MYINLYQLRAICPNFGLRFTMYTIPLSLWSVHITVLFYESVLILGLLFFFGTALHHSAVFGVSYGALFFPPYLMILPYMALSAVLMHLPYGLFRRIWL